MGLARRDSHSRPRITRSSSPSPARRFGITALPAAIDFKWADNLQQTGDWSDFTLNGDAAPNDRYNFRANFQGDLP